ncbi:MAG: hypothetical protein IT376_03115 [Polyangiaceae bacterium]|nr:hypothetical protein [Polyangiaceae bacterium]
MAAFLSSGAGSVRALVFVLASAGLPLVACDDESSSKSRRGGGAGDAAAEGSLGGNAGAGSGGSSGAGGSAGLAGAGGAAGAAGADAGPADSGPDAPVPEPGQPGVDLVGGGVTMSSANHRAIVTLGQAPGGNGVSTSAGHRFVGGVVGATQ